MKDRSIHSKASGDRVPGIPGRGPRRPFPLGLYTTPQSKLRLPARLLGQSKWRILWVAFIISILTFICTDGYIFALAVSGSFSISMLTVYLHEQRIDRQRCYLRLEWILLGYSLPVLANTALIPLQVQWYPVASNALPHIRLHLLFPAMGMLVTTCLLERYCLNKITRSPGARDERRLQLSISNVDLRRDR